MKYHYWAIDHVAVFLEHQGNLPRLRGKLSSQIARELAHSKTLRAL